MNRIFAFMATVLFASSLAVAQTPVADSSAQIPVASADSPEVAQFQKIEDAWTVSYNQRDQYGMELALSPLFVDVSATGEITTRNQQVAQLLSSEDKSQQLTHHVITVRMLGDVAVVNGTYSLHHKVNGNPVEDRGVYTHVFEKVRSGWLCINSQRTQLRETTPTAVAKQKKQASAELPFHIPLFSKSDKSSTQSQ